MQIRHRVDLFEATASPLMDNLRVAFINVSRDGGPSICCCVGGGEANLLQEAIVTDGLFIYCHA